MVVPQERRRVAGRVGAALVAAAVGGACVVARRAGGGAAPAASTALRASVAAAAAATATSSSAAPAVRITNVYGEWDRDTLYPWDELVEPYRDTKFQVANDQRCDLSVAHVAGSGFVVRRDDAPVTVTTTATASNAMTAVFTRPSGDYVLTASCDDGTGTTTRHAYALKCKYVRREIRLLTAAHLAAYMNATALVHTLSLAEGQRTFGPKFKNYEYFTRKHLAQITLEGW